MTPFRVPWTGGTQIGAMWIEQQRTESCRGYGAGKGGQPAAERGGGVAGAELSANQTGVGAVSRRGRDAKALQHGNCGRVSNRSYSETFRQAVLDQVRTRYADFGPTLAAEHLAEEAGLAVAAETLRRWMKAAGLWRGQRRRKAYRQRRERQPHFGELVQLDA